MNETTLKKPMVSSVADYLTKGFGGRSPVDSPMEASRSSGVLHDSNLEKALQATNHLLDAGKDGNEDLVQTLEDFGLEMSEASKADQQLFIKSLTQFQSQLEGLKSSTEDYIKESILPSENVNKEDKEDIVNTFNEVTNIKEFSDFRSSTKVFKNDADFLVKTLSALRNGLEDAEANLDEADFSALTNTIDEQSAIFYDTGEVNNAVIQDILDKTMGLVDESNKRLVTIDSEEKVQAVIKDRVETKVDQLSRERVREIVNTTLEQNNLETSDISTSYTRGDVSTNDLLDHLKKNGLMQDSDISKLSGAIDEALSRDSAAQQLTAHLEEDLEPLFIQLGDDARTQIELQKQAHLEGKISAAELRATMEDRLSAVGELTSEQTGQLSLMETRLTHIDENTEQGKVSSADKIRNSNRKQSEDETADGLQDLLSDIQTRDNATVRSSMFAGASGAEDLGEQAMDSLFDQFGGGDAADYIDGDDRNDRKRRGRRGRNSRSRKPKRKGFKGLLDKGKGFLGKGKDMMGKGGGLGSKLLKVGGAATAVGMGAYNMFSAEDTKGRKDAAGSTTGALVGGALGSLLGPLGTVAGAYIGSEIGEWMAGTDWFSSPQDSIPDKVKDKGPQAELDFIGSTLLPEMQNSLATQSGAYDEDDIEEIKEYALSLRSKIKETREELTPESAEVMNLHNQGASPEMISMFTNTPAEDVNKIISSSNAAAHPTSSAVMAQTSAPDKIFSEPKKKTKTDESAAEQRTVVHKTEDNRTYITKSQSSRRDSMRDQLRSSY